MQKVVLITGANGGIGSSIARVFGNKGYGLVLNYYEEKVEVNRIKERFGAENVLAVQADITRREKVKIMVDVALKKFGRIDILVNNAGIINDKTFLEMDEKAWDEVINTNLNGVFNVTNIVYKVMVKNNYGVIINISSIVGENGNYGQTNYSATKSALIGFTKSLAKEGAKYGVRVNAIAPGFIDTPMTSNLPQEVKKKIIGRIPLRRFGRPEEIAKAVLFICECEYMTSAILDINGGLTL